MTTLRRTEVWLIPAHAGKTSGRIIVCHIFPAHPRSRGENLSGIADSLTPVGSSPLTRGKLDSGGEVCAVRRLIPAHAGKTQARGCRMPRRTAHPRSRGENDADFLIGQPRCGSSPLTRGKRRAKPAGQLLQRLIPAHAGKTPAPRPRTASSTAHPRSRGENNVTALRYSTCPGSSPLTRGKHWRRVERDCDWRLIPAHAGKTVTLPSRRYAAWAHPRSRGENAPTPKSIHGDSGSSPLTRGKPVATTTIMKTLGLIPAHAGKTLATPSGPQARAAHPRSRGENVHDLSDQQRCQGSSPLTRGKLL